MRNIRNMRNTQRIKADIAILTKVYNDIGDIWDELEKMYVTLGDVCEEINRVHEELGEYLL